MKKLYKSKQDRKLAGVCGGLSEYFEVDVTIIRVAFAIFGFMAWGLIAYIICAIVMPEDPNQADYYQ